MTLTVTSGLIGWYDASAITGLNDGDQVATWTDSSPAADNLTQSTSSLRPIYKTNIVFGNPVVRFDGTDDQMTNTAFTNQAQPVQWFVAFKASDASRLVNLIHGGNEILRRADNAVELWAGVTLTDAAMTHNGSVWSTWSGLFNGASSALWANGTSYTGGNAGSGSAGTTLRVGDHGGGGRAFAGDMAEILIYNRALSAPEVADVFTYLSDRYLASSKAPPIVSRRLNYGALLQV